MIDLSRWPNADDVLDRALALPRHERPGFLRGEAGADTEFLAALTTVLAEDETTSEFLSPGSAITGALAADLAAALDPDDADAPRLQAGQTFGGYDVIGVLGHGGMGEVYRARDPRLGREVALKVLPARFAADPGRHARLEREARLLASVNDPHIAAIYELEEHQGIGALVMELVEGSTLAERIARGRLPIPTALDIAEQIAFALIAAHRRGIIHRDLKPANVKITPDAGVKVLDFGIATAVAPDGEDAVSPEATTRSSSEAAVMLFGTASYTSPERARGQKTDHRADIWAFGCVLFEMLTGVKAFDGASPGAILARVTEREPEFSRLPVRTPAAIHRLLERALRKDPDRRLGFIGDALLDIEDARAELAGASTQPVPRAHQRRARVVAVAALAAGLALGGAAIWVWLRPGPAVASHLALPVPEGDDLVVGEIPGLAISPDGRTVVYRARRDGVMQLVRRSMGENVATPIEGSKDGAAPFFSPDGQWIGFSNDVRLLKVSVTGGKPAVVADAPGGARGSWAPDDTIWFSSGTARVIYRVPSGGGTPEAVTSLDEPAGDQTHTAPSVFPDGGGAVVTVTRSDGVHVGIVSSGSGLVRVLFPGRQPQALSGGRIIFARGEVLWAARLADDRQTVAAEPTAALTGVELSGAGTAQFAASDAGSLVYMPRLAVGEVRVPVWLDRAGTETLIPIDAKPYTRGSVSPDGTRIALAVASPENRDIWVYEIARKALMRLTVDPAADTAPIWSPDSRRIAFRSDRDGGGIFVQAADGADTAMRVTRSVGPARPAHTPYSFTPDGQTVVFAELRSYSDQGIGVAAIGGSGVPTMVLDGPFAESRPALAPNGRWLAYQSDESGRYEIYVRPYPDVMASRVQVSTTGGSSARWSADGRELLYFDGTSIVAAPVRSYEPVTFGRPVALFDATRFNERLGPVYDVAPDRRFLFLRAAGPTGEPVRRGDLLVITNWVQTLASR
jgi:serine/threonine-protein kinase